MVLCCPLCAWPLFPRPFSACPTWSLVRCCPTVGQRTPPLLGLERVGRQLPLPPSGPPGRVLVKTLIAEWLAEWGLHTVVCACSLPVALSLHLCFLLTQPLLRASPLVLCVNFEVHPPSENLARSCQISLSPMLVGSLRSVALGLGGRLNLLQFQAQQRLLSGGPSFTSNQVHHFCDL
jgi:hypothetical protein